ncbi:GntR family transcriptional regulator [Vibrio sp. MA40-2]|uniref:GntR family transcriptional regulator n=1 Tax=Vibrio sp. MA40-2 TaxID=3391828 RepID=UPI0039A772B0
MKHLENTMDLIDSIDSQLEVPLSVQLRGVIEYGITSGELKPGCKLPTIRMIASRTGMSPVTVSNVFAKLKKIGLLESKVGAGTYVANYKIEADQNALFEIDKKIEELLKLAKKADIEPHVISTRLFLMMKANPKIKIMILGIFAKQTQYYLDVIKDHICNDQIVFQSSTVDQAKNNQDSCINYVLGPINVNQQAKDIWPNAEFIAFNLIPNQQTRIALASIDSNAKVTVVSYFSGFISFLKTNMKKFAPHVNDINFVHHVPGELTNKSHGCDVLIYSTGVDITQEKLPKNVVHFEYQYVPDMNDLNKQLHSRMIL